MDALDGWTRTEHTADVAGRATTHPVWRRGSGPGVVVIHEMPGLTAGVTRFGTSGTATILDDATARESGGTVTARVDATSY